MICNICKNEDYRIFKAREMYYGMNDCFDYLECSNCGCIQIVDVPTDMSIYYPLKDYYSFQKKELNIIQSILQKQRDRYAVFRSGFLGHLVYKKFPFEFLYFLGTLKLNPDLKILDVGCGSGRLIHSLEGIGFKNLTGIDPYIAEETIGENLSIMKKTIFDLPDINRFDLIIFSHSFEHMIDQFEVIDKVERLLNRNGYCIIEMPIKSDYIWKLYRENWLQLDAPRHFLIHTIKSFNYLMEKSNLQLEKIVFNSNEVQFWGSELYKRNIPIKDENTLLDEKKNLFSKDQVNKFKEKSVELNKRNQGDQAIFILKKTNDS